MPKDTFLKLSEEKQQRILDAAAEEFIEYKDNYDKASVKRIAEKADIAIGSIYKYFEDKDELFFYLFRLTKTRTASVSDAKTLREFAKEELKMTGEIDETGTVLLDIIYANRRLFDKLIFGDVLNSPYYQQIYRHIEKDRDNGLLRENIDLNLAAYLYSTMEFTAYNYCQQFDLDMEKEDQYIDALFDIIFSGIYK